MRLKGCVWVLGLALAACGGESDVGGSGSSTTTDVGSSSTSGTPGTTTGISSGGSSSTTGSASSSTTDPGTSSSTGAAESSSSSTSGAESSSSTGCTPGEADCACDEGMCVEGFECSPDDICEIVAECVDDEYGDTPSLIEAYHLGEINDNDANGGTISGVLTGPDDVDWFRYDGNDVAFNSVDPFRTINSSAGVRFCKFANCPPSAGATNFPCQDGATATTSPEGYPGCCGNPLIHVPDAVCGNSSLNDDDMAVWIRIDQAEEACVEYTFDYHF